MNLKEALEVLFGEHPKKVQIVSGSEGFDGEVLLPAICCKSNVDIAPIDEIRDAEFEIVEDDIEDRLPRGDFKVEGCVSGRIEAAKPMFGQEESRIYRIGQPYVKPAIQIIELTPEKCQEMIDERNWYLEQLVKKESNNE